MRQLQESCTARLTESKPFFAIYRWPANLESLWIVACKDEVVSDPSLVSVTKIGASTTADLDEAAPSLAVRSKNNANSQDSYQAGRQTGHQARCVTRAAGMDRQSRQIRDRPASP